VSEDNVAYLAYAITPAPKATRTNDIRTNFFIKLT
jgi:hypothetical protein